MTKPYGGVEQDDLLFITEQSSVYARDSGDTPGYSSAIRSGANMRNSATNVVYQRKRHNSKDWHK